MDRRLYGNIVKSHKLGPFRDKVFDKSYIFLRHVVWELARSSTAGANTGRTEFEKCKLTLKYR